MSDVKSNNHNEIIDEQAFEECLEEIQLIESRGHYNAEREQGGCSFKEICIHCPCVGFTTGGVDSSCDVCEKQLSNNKCYENYLRKKQMNGTRRLKKNKEKSGAGLSTLQKKCTTCEEYNLRYENCKGYVATIRVEAETIEAELEGIEIEMGGIEHVRGRTGRDGAYSSALDEVYSSVLLRRIRLIQNFTDYLITSRPITKLHEGVCRVHTMELPTVKLLEDVISNLLKVIWRGDINYVPHLQRSGN